jgi:hypothetical protein
MRLRPEELRGVVLKMHRGFFTTTLTPDEVQPLIDAAAKYKAIDRAFHASELISAVVPK